MASENYTELELDSQHTNTFEIISHVVRTVLSGVQLHNRKPSLKLNTFVFVDYLATSFTSFLHL